jgi:hypothetical protein
MNGHGYSAYSNGCRCQVCRDAKAAYMSSKRKEATASAQAGMSVESARHGTRVAYKDYGCRCETCVHVMRAIWRRWSRNARTVTP